MAQASAAVTLDDRAPVARSRKVAPRTAAGRSAGLAGAAAWLTFLVFLLTLGLVTTRERNARGQSPPAPAPEPEAPAAVPARVPTTLPARPASGAAPVRPESFETAPPRPTPGAAPVLPQVSGAAQERPLALEAGPARERIIVVPFPDVRTRAS